MSWQLPYHKTGREYAAPVVSFHVGPKRPEQREMIREPHL